MARPQTACWVLVRKCKFRMLEAIPDTANFRNWARSGSQGRSVYSESGRPASDIAEPHQCCSETKTERSAERSMAEVEEEEEEEEEVLECYTASLLDPVLLNDIRGLLR